MATEFKVVFEGEISPTMAAEVNRAVQKAVLNIVADSFPNPDDDNPRHHGPAGPVELSSRILIRGIVVAPQRLVESE